MGVVHDGDAVDLASDDFRRLRRMLAPQMFALVEGPEEDLPPRELVDRRAWDGIMDLPTDVALRALSHEGQSVEALHHLTHVWTFQLPLEPDAAPFMFEPALLAGEEFNALVFIALHGYYRQAFGCLRNALEVLTIGAGLGVTRNSGFFERWRAGDTVPFGNARDWLAASQAGQAVDAMAAPTTVFAGQLSTLYSRLCGYAHSRAGTNNMDFWESNGPVHVWRLLDRIRAEVRDTLAMGLLLLTLGSDNTALTQDAHRVLNDQERLWLSAIRPS